MISVMALLLMAACQPVETGPGSEQLVGGDKDEHGCIASAGYTWCESKQKCLRTWEEECLLTQEQVYGPEGQDKAIQVAKAYIEGTDEFKKRAAHDTQVVKATQGSCQGCWLLDVDYYFASKDDPEKLDKATVQLTMENWTVIDSRFMEGAVEMQTPKGCVLQGGRVVNTVTGQTCKDSETKIADIKGFQSPHICCK